MRLAERCDSGWRLLVCFRRAAVAALAVVALAGAATSARADSSCALATLSGGNQPACWRPFTAHSPINTELPARPRLAADNLAVQRHMAAYGWTMQGTSTQFEIGDTGTRPVYFATPTDPLMTVNCTGEEGPKTCQGANGVDINGARIHIPPGAKPGSNWDAHLTVIETVTGQEYDFWHATISGSTITAATGAVENVNTSDGTRDMGDAANLALSAGVLRPSELASGHINHALVVNIPCTNAHGPNVGYSWPAMGGWGETCGQYWNESPTGAPTIGQLFKLNMTDAQIAASGAPTWEQTIMTALAHYGAYAEDTSGSWHDESILIVTQDSSSWTGLGQPNQWVTSIPQLTPHAGILASSIPIPTSRLQVVDPCVPRGTCANSSRGSRARRSRKHTPSRRGRLKRRKHHRRRAVPAGPQRLA